MQLLTFQYSFLEVLTDAWSMQCQGVLKPVGPEAAELSSEIFWLHGSAHQHNHLEAEITTLLQVFAVTK